MKPGVIHMGNEKPQRFVRAGGGNPAVILFVGGSHHDISGRVLKVRNPSLLKCLPELADDMSLPEWRRGLFQDLLQKRAIQRIFGSGHGFYPDNLCDTKESPPLE